MKKFVYSFSEGSKEMKKILGGKGANLSEMTKIGLSVPPGFTISTEACNEYYRNDKKLWKDLVFEINSKLDELENNLGKKIRWWEQPAIGFCKIRGCFINAWYDGYSFKPWA